jgi:integration host factor subunit beta
VKRGGDFLQVGRAWKLCHRFSMTKNELINQLAVAANIPKPKASAVVETIFETMTHALMKNDRIEIRGFGTLGNREYEARKGRNPRTGRAIRVPQKKMPHYKMAKEFRAELIEAYQDDSSL